MWLFSFDTKTRHIVQLGSHTYNLHIYTNISLETITHAVFWGFYQYISCHLMHSFRNFSLFSIFGIAVLGNCKSFYHTFWLDTLVSHCIWSKLYESELARLIAKVPYRIFPFSFCCFLYRFFFCLVFLFDIFFLPPPPSILPFHESRAYFVTFFDLFIQLHLLLKKNCALFRRNAAPVAGRTGLRGELGCGAI